MKNFDELQLNKIKLDKINSKIVLKRALSACFRFIVQRIIYELSLWQISIKMFSSTPTIYKVTNASINQ